MCKAPCITAVPHACHFQLLAISLSPKVAQGTEHALPTETQRCHRSLILCDHVAGSRWISAGAFYPFARNHYGYYTRPHELYRWPSMVDSGRKALTLRYRLLTYMYSAFFMANQLGGTVARALFFSFPADEGARYAAHHVTK